jgi:hypothetical protein
MCSHYEIFYDTGLIKCMMKQLTEQIERGFDIVLKSSDT